MCEAIAVDETSFCYDETFLIGSAYDGPIDFTIEEGERGLHISIQTQCLAIETIKARDIEAYEALFTIERVMKTYASGEAKRAGEISMRILESWIPRWESGDPYSAMAVRTHDGEFIGHVVMGYDADETSGYSEIAYVIAEKH